MLHFDWMTVENAVRERGRRPVDVFLFRCGFQGIHNFLPQHLGQNPARPVLAPWIKQIKHPTRQHHDFDRFLKAYGALCVLQEHLS